MKSFLAGILVVGGLVVSSAQIPQGALPLDPVARARRQHHARLRRLVSEPRRQLQLLRRLLQPEHQGNARHPGRRRNKIEPGAADQGQPTHFEIGRQWGVFVDQGAEGFRHQDDHLDHRLKRREAVDSVHA